MITISIGGKKRPFKFGIYAARVFTRETGKSLNDLNSIDDGDLDAIISILFAGLSHGAKLKGDTIDFDSDDVCLWMDDMDQDEITKAFESMKDNTAEPSQKKK